MNFCSHVAQTDWKKDRQEIDRQISDLRKKDAEIKRKDVELLLI